MTLISLRAPLRALFHAAALAFALGALAAPSAEARSRGEINAGVDATLQELFAIAPGAKEVYAKAYATLVFPNIVKGGVLLGFSYGQGGLVVNGVVESYWSYGAGSLGVQFGAHRVRRVMFFMSKPALELFLGNDGATLAADAELTVVDGGGDIGLDFTIHDLDILVVNFSQEGFLGGASFRGGTYRRLDKR